MKIEIEKVILTTSISSASGLAVADNNIWMIGDDVDYVVKSTIGHTDFSRIKLYESASEQRIAKPVKHDLESCTLGDFEGEQFLFVLAQVELALIVITYLP